MKKAKLAKKPDSKTSEEILNRSAYCVFADEIRSEVNGKQTIIGIYGSDVIVPQFPFTFETLSLQITVRTPVDNLFKEVRFFLSIPGQENSTELTTVTGPFSDKRKSPSDRYFQLTYASKLKNIVVPEKGEVIVWAQIDNEKMFVGKMRLALPENQFNPDILVAPMLHYKKMRENLAQNLRDQLAIDIVNLIVSELPDYPVNDSGDMVVPLANNRVKIYFSKILKDDTKVTVNMIPTDVDFKVLEQNSIGMIIEINSGMARVQEISLQYED